MWNITIPCIKNIPYEILDTKLKNLVSNIVVKNEFFIPKIVGNRIKVIEKG
jgi:hypothetical protein